MKTYFYGISDFYGHINIYLASGKKINQKKFDEMCSSITKKIVSSTNDFVSTEEVALYLVENYNFKYIKSQAFHIH